MNKAIEMAIRSLEIEKKAVGDVLEKMDWAAFEKAATVLSECDRIITCASGSSGIAAKKFAHTLCCIERPAQFLPPCEAMHGGLGSIQKGNVVVIVSRGGKKRGGHADFRGRSKEGRDGNRRDRESRISDGEGVAYRPPDAHRAGERQVQYAGNRKLHLHTVHLE